MVPIDALGPLLIYFFLFPWKNVTNIHFHPVSWGGTVNPSLSTCVMTSYAHELRSQ